MNSVAKNHTTIFNMEFVYFLFSLNELILKSPQNIKRPSTCHNDNLGNPKGYRNQPYMSHVAQALNRAIGAISKSIGNTIKGVIITPINCSFILNSFDSFIKNFLPLLGNKLALIRATYRQPAADHLAQIQC